MRPVAHLLVGVLVSVSVVGIAGGSSEAADAVGSGVDPSATVDTAGACVRDATDSAVARVTRSLDPSDVPVGTGVVVSPAGIEVPAALPAGTVLTCTITVRNRRSETTTFAVEAASITGSRTRGTSATFGEPQQGSVVAETVHPAVAALTLAPREVARVPVRITATQGAGYAAIYVTPRVRQGAARAPQVGVEGRVAVALLLRIVGSGRPKLELSDVRAPRLRVNRASWRWRANLDDVGTVHATPRGQLRVRSIFGSLVAELPIAAPPLLPGGRTRLDVTWRQVPWFGVYRYEAEVGTTFERRRITTTHSGWFVALPPWWVLALVGAAVLALVASRRRARAQRRQRWSSQDSDQDGGSASGGGGD